MAERNVFKYSGKEKVENFLSVACPRHELKSSYQLLFWAVNTLGISDTAKVYEFNYVVLISGEIFTAACDVSHGEIARGQDVLAAGGMVYERLGKHLSLQEVTNAAADYLPDADAWRGLNDAFTAIHFPHIKGFSNLSKV